VTGEREGDAEHVMSLAVRSRRLRAGTLSHVQFRSRILKDNPAGDAIVRDLPVYLPDRCGTGLPVVFLLAGFTGTGEDYLDSHPWHPGVLVEYDGALQRGEVPAAILAMPNCFTKYGGSQYVNSSYLGRYEDHVVEELTALVDESFPTLAGRRGVVGKSSGGIGALHLAMRHPEVFPVAASISGDCGFEGCHAPAFWECLRALVPYGGDASKFVEDFLARPDLTGDKFGAINTIAMAACYSPNPDSPIGCDLPIDTHTGERIERVWQRWLAFDPVHACERYADNLKRLELLHIECGLRDEYNIQWGTRQLAAKLEHLGVAHVHEEHDGGHRGIQERYLRILPTVIQRLAAQG
jgi:enterochelin esterase family protein